MGGTGVGRGKGGLGLVGARGGLGLAGAGGLGLGGSGRKRRGLSHVTTTCSLQQGESRRVKRRKRERKK